VAKRPTPQSTRSCQTSPEHGQSTSPASLSAEGGEAHTPSDVRHTPSGIAYTVVGVAHTSSGVARAPSGAAHTPPDVRTGEERGTPEDVEDVDPFPEARVNPKP
jgi:hypothetical protein